MERTGLFPTWRLGTQVESSLSMGKKEKSHERPFWTEELASGKQIQGLSYLIHQNRHPPGEAISPTYLPCEG